MSLQGPLTGNDSSSNIVHSMMRNHAKLPVYLLFAAILTLSLAACVTDEAPPSIHPPGAIETSQPPAIPPQITLTPSGESPMTSPPASEAPDPDLNNPLIALAKQDLGKRLDVSPKEIEVVSFELVVWPDSSLGCPQPGMEYLQVPQDGALILLRFAETPYEYHSGGSRGVFLCEKLKVDPGEKPTQIDLLKLTPPTPDNYIPPGEDQ